MTELLIIKPSSLGDIVQALQVATSLKAQVEGLRISWVVREIFAPIVRAYQAVDHVYVFERNAGAKGGVEGCTLVATHFHAKVVVVVPQLPELPPQPRHGDRRARSSCLPSARWAPPAPPQRAPPPKRVRVPR